MIKHKKASGQEGPSYPEIGRKLLFFQARSASPKREKEVTNLRGGKKKKKPSHLLAVPSNRGEKRGL